MSLPGVLLVSEVFPPAIGGSGILLENVYSRLADTQVTVLTEGPPGTGSVRRRSLRVHHVPMGAPDWGIVRPSSFVRHLRVAAAIRRLTPPGGVVHCGRALPEGLSARLAQWRTGAPYVCWTHGEELGFASTSRELTALTRWIYRTAQAVIANSKNSARLLAESWGVPSGKIHVVYPGVDVARFNPEVDGSVLRARVARPGDVVFLSVGRLQRRKGHDVVLSALAALPPAPRPVKYVIIGDGPHRRELEEQARRLGLGDIVEFVGAVPEAELPQWYRASDVFVLPNRTDGVDFEGFGIVFLEAAASGLPSIAGRSGGVPEAVGDSAIIVDGDNAAEVSAAMQTLSASPELRQQLGTAARLRARQQFTWEQSANSLRVILRQLAG